LAQSLFLRVFFMLHSRTKRVEESIRQAVSLLFQQEVQDPRLPAIFTVSHVHVTKDLRQATIHYSQLPDDDEAVEATAEMIDDCRKYVRSRVAEMVNLKFAPDIHFRYSEGEKHFQRINTILKRLEDEGGSRDESGD
jgi:ribosome-binding factor A